MPHFRVQKHVNSKMEHPEFQPQYSIKLDLCQSTRKIKHPDVARCFILYLFRYVRQESHEASAFDGY